MPDVFPPHWQVYVRELSYRHDNTTIKPWVGPSHRTLTQNHPHTAAVRGVMSDGMVDP